MIKMENHHSRPVAAGSANVAVVPDTKGDRPVDGPATTAKVTPLAVAEFFDDRDSRIEALQADKKKILDRYRAQMLADGLSKSVMRHEIDALKIAVRRRRLDDDGRRAEVGVEKRAAEILAELMKPVGTAPATRARAAQESGQAANLQPVAKTASGDGYVAVVPRSNAKSETMMVAADDSKRVAAPIPTKQAKTKHAPGEASSAAGRAMPEALEPLNVDTPSAKGDRPVPRPRKTAADNSVATPPASPATPQSPTTPESTAAKALVAAAGQSEQHEKGWEATV